MHEEPYIVGGNTRPLEPGMAFRVEPGVYLAGEWGARIEDIVVVTDDGVERLNTRPRDLVVLLERRPGSTRRVRPSPGPGTQAPVGLAGAHERGQAAADRGVRRGRRVERLLGEVEADRVEPAVDQRARVDRDPPLPVLRGVLVACTPRGPRWRAAGRGTPHRCARPPRAARPTAPGTAPCGPTAASARLYGQPCAAFSGIMRSVTGAA